MQSSNEGAILVAVHESGRVHHVAHALLDPQLVEADVSLSHGESEFDPQVVISRIEILHCGGLCRVWEVLSSPRNPEEGSSS
jgi:hypothetical protein